MIKKKDIYIAVIISLVVNVIVLLFVNESVQLGGTKSKGKVVDYIDMDFVELDSPEDAFESTLEEQIETQLNNLIANRAAELSNEKSSFSEGQKSSMNKSVEELVKELEDKLKDEEEDKTYDYDKPKEIDQFTKNGTTPGDDKSFNGTVAVSYYLPNPDRNHKYLPVPAYLCKQGGIVTIKVTVNNSGSITQYSIDESKTNTQDACLREEALSHARISEFKAMSNAPKKHNGAITYTFEKQ